MIRGIPDIVFFLFIPIALDQAFEYLRHKVLCSDVTEPIGKVMTLSFVKLRNFL